MRYTFIVATDDFLTAFRIQGIIRRELSYLTREEFWQSDTPKDMDVALRLTRKEAEQVERALGRYIEEESCHRDTPLEDSVYYKLEALLHG